MLNSSSQNESAAGTGAIQRLAFAWGDLSRHWLGSSGQRRAVRNALGIVAVLALIGAIFSIFGRGENLPDMSAYPAGAERKAAFFGFMAPIVQARNGDIRDDREKLLQMEQKFAAEGRLSILDEIWLKRLAERYAVDWEAGDLDAVFAELGRRVDIVPRPLVLVQAAKESGWGTSRFAREANNLFGQWCYRKGCGLVPARRAADASHEVRKFDSVGEAVDAYLRNINTSKAYARLRQIRLAQRRRGKQPAAEDLAEGLQLYSQRRSQYVDELQSMLRHYHEFQQQSENP